MEEAGASKLIGMRLRDPADGESADQVVALPQAAEEQEPAGEPGASAAEEAA